MIYGIQLRGIHHSDSFLDVWPPHPLSICCTLRTMHIAASPVAQHKNVFPIVNELSQKALPSECWIQLGIVLCNAQIKRHVARQSCHLCFFGVRVRVRACVRAGLRARGHNVHA